MALPSWLQVTPRDYTQSSQAGGQAGLEAAGIVQRGQIARDESIRRQQQLALEAQAQSQRYSMEQDRLAQQMSIAQMETQARKEIAQQQAARNQQQIALSNAMRQEQLGIAKGHLERQQMMDQERIKAAASAYQDQQGFADAIASGVPVAEALRRFPRTPRGIVSTLGPHVEKDFGDIVTEKVPGGTITHWKKGGGALNFRPDRPDIQETFATKDAQQRLTAINKQLDEAQTPDKSGNVNEDRIRELGLKRAQIMSQFAPRRQVAPQIPGAPAVEAPPGPAMGPPPVPESMQTAPAAPRFRLPKGAKEGDKFRNPNDLSQVFIVRNGEAVPYTGETQAPAADEQDVSE